MNSFHFKMYIKLFGYLKVFADYEMELTKSSNWEMWEMFVMQMTMHQITNCARCFSDAS